nr:hypothetical protein [bacterium]
MKKLLTMGLVIATMSWTLGLMGMVTVPVANAAAAGDLIKTPNNPAVYYLGADNKRYVFPTFNTYKTWFGTNFSTVKTISLTEMGNINMGGNVPYRAGTRLIKLSNDPKTYAVEPSGVIRHIPTETVASDLYGSLWYKLVDVLDDSFFASAYTYGSALTTLYPSGSLVKEPGGSTIYYINGTEKRPVASEAAFLANNFQWDNVRTHSLADYSVGTSITGAESALITVAGSGSPITPEANSTGALTVSLASDTPAAATVVKNATRVKFTKLNFTATGGDVTVDTMTIQRYGLAQDSNFANVYILAAADESMVGNEKTLGSAHTAVVNDDITIANGTTKSYYIAATMHTTLQAGEVAGLGLSAITVKGSASVSVSLPVTGNSMTMNNTITLGTVTPADGGSATSATKPVGTTNYVFASLKLTANSTEDVQVEKIRFYQQGTAADADLANLKLVVDGNVLATVAKATDKAVVFDLSSSPFSITKGNNKIFELKGDI